MNDSVRWQQRFDHFRRALMSIESVAAGYNQMSDLEHDGLIQRFQYTFDLAWKVMQDYLRFVGYNNISGPRASLTQMAKDGFIDPFVWEELLIARNELSHVYSEIRSREHLTGIVQDFLPAFREFRSKMEEKIA